MHTPPDPSVRMLRAGALALAGGVLALLALVGPACPATSRAPEARTPLVITVGIPVPYPVPMPVPTPRPHPAPMQLTVVGCSHGTVGVSSTNLPQPHWVITSLHLRSPKPLKGLRLASIELLDKRGRVVTRSAKIEAFRIGHPRVSYPDRCLPYARQRPYHLSKANTHPFAGQIAARKRHRLWLHVRMTDDYFRVARAHPARCRVTFTASGGRTHQAQTHQIGTWPTG